MVTSKSGFSRPERFVLTVARGPEGYRGRVLRVADESTMRFESLEELLHWLVELPDQPEEGNHPDELG